MKINRLVLLSLQALVAVVLVLSWHVASTTSLLGEPKNIQFFFSTPYKVIERVIKWFSEGTIWYHLGITGTEAMLAFVIGSIGGVVLGFWFA